MKRDASATLDLVIPVYNEEDVIPLLFERLGEVFSPDALRKHGLDRVRYLIIDDGSTDRSARLVCERIEQGAPAVLWRLSRNFGHQCAVSAGLDLTDADLTAVIDCDLQDPPELILDMVDRWREGYDVVYGMRRKRQESIIKRVGYRGFYRLVAFLSELKIPLDSGDFSLLDRKVVQAMRDLPERLRIPRVLRAWVGFRQVGIEFDRPARLAGRPKYNLARLYRLATDGIASSSIRLLKMAQLFSFTYAVLTLILLVVVLTVLLRGVEDRTLLYFLFGYILMALGNFVVTACLYILGAYVGRTYLETKGRPPYVIMETVGAD